MLTYFFLNMVKNICKHVHFNSVYQCYQNMFDTLSIGDSILKEFRGMNRKYVKYIPNQILLDAIMLLLPIQQLLRSTTTA